MLYVVQKPDAESEGLKNISKKKMRIFYKMQKEKIKIGDILGDTIIMDIGKI